MLNRAHRLVHATDFRRVTRRGTKATSTLATVSAMANDRGLCRFGIITSRAVGNAPTRNTLRRRIRAIASEVPDRLSSDVVIRVQPAAAEATWNELREDIMAHIKQAINA